MSSVGWWTLNEENRQALDNLTSAFAPNVYRFPRGRAGPEAKETLRPGRRLGPGHIPGKAAPVDARTPGRRPQSRLARLEALEDARKPCPTF